MIRNLFMNNKLDNKNTELSTKVTYINGKWHCRILKNGVPYYESVAESRKEIGPVFRALLRDIDKYYSVGDEFTSAARKRPNHKHNNKVKWPGEQ